MSLIDLTPTEELAQVLPADLAAEVVKARKAIKKPLTAYAARLLAVEIRKCADPIAAVNKMILNGWQKVYPDEQPLQKTQRFPAAPNALETRRQELAERITNEHGIGRQAGSDYGNDAGPLFLAGPDNQWRH